MRGLRWAGRIVALGAVLAVGLPRCVAAEGFFGEPVADLSSDGSSNSDTSDQVPGAAADAGSQTTNVTTDAAVRFNPAAANHPDNPFTRRVPAIPFPEKLEWLNTDRSYSLQDFRGRFLVLDFWTYCCINCMHVLPELKKLEHAYPNELAVVGVHSAKFDTEKDRENIKEAILRYEIEHPVVNDSEHVIWNAYGVRSWPTILVIDPTGHVVYGQPGEFRFEDIKKVFDAGIPFYRKQGLLVNAPLGNKRLSETAEDTRLRFPGKVYADEAGERLFISDSNHNQILVTTLDGEVLDTIGSGDIGRSDGTFATASFDHPQGVALHGDVLYVADTENHMVRKVDLRSKRVTTIAGTGIQARHGWPGLDAITNEAQIPDRWAFPPLTTELSSPWALWVHDEQLLIAMAGPHQIWTMPLDESEIGPYAGNGREDIVDGPPLPKVPYKQGYASFAQPSGLTSDGTFLYVADSEGSSVRKVPLNGRGRVTTLLGTSGMSVNRLFTFGDVDGPTSRARLQHPLEVVYHDNQIYIADTYNNKIKQLDVRKREITTLAGTGEPGYTDDPARFDEPAGLAYAAGKLYVADTNNHAIRVIDLANGNQVTTLAITSSTDAEQDAPNKRKPSFPGAQKVKVEPQSVRLVEDKLKVVVELSLPDGWKLNPDAPMGYLLELAGEAGVVDRKAVGEYVRLKKPTKKLEVSLPASGPGKETLTVSMNYYFCDDEVCKTGSVILTAPLTIDAKAEKSAASLKYKIDPTK